MDQPTLKWTTRYEIPPIAVHENASLTRVAQYENDASYGDELYVM